VSVPVDLVQTRMAFDSVAAFYDGPFGNNAIVQRMRRELLGTVIGRVAGGGRLLDLGCGTGLDAVALAARGYRVTAIDSSPAMVARTRARAAAEGLGDRVAARELGIEALERLDEAPFDGVYSDLGALNCVPDLAALAARCAALVAPGGALVVSVIGRLCPWELAYATLRGNLGRARVRFASGPVPVSLNGHTVWTWYYRPREFARPFRASFALEGYRALGLCLPPPYLVGLAERRPALAGALAWLDRKLGRWPVLRNAGDHFLMVLRRHG
jgi:SAM-dependent methyltransferase